MSLTRQAKIEKYQDRGGGYRWRLLAANGKIIADSSEAYASASGLNRAVLSVIAAFRKNLKITDSD